MTLIIGLAGMGHVGKTTLANRLIAEHGFTRVSFAEPIRQMLYALGVSEHETRDEVLKHTPHPLLEGRTPVFAMETLGTAWGRDIIGEGLWSGRAVQYAQQFDRVVFDDVRYQNEVTSIYERNGLCYRLWDPTQVPERNSDRFVARLTGCQDLEPRSDASYDYIVNDAIGDAVIPL